MNISINSGFEITGYSIHCPKVTEDTRLAVIADLHNCMCEDDGRRLFNVIYAKHPDLVIIAGDLLVSASHEDARPAMRFLKLLSEKIGVPVIYGVGNHERKVLERECLIHQKRQLAKGIKESGVRLFSNVRKVFEERNICVLGLDLPIKYYSRFKRTELEPDTIEKLLGPLDKDRFNILIAHDPLRFKDYVSYGPDLVLSGHVHGGVVRLPFLGGVLSPEFKLFPKYDAGEYREDQTTMLVSKGLGNHTINVRVNNPTELVIVDIKAGE